MATTTPAERQHQSASPLGVNNYESVQRTVASAEGMQEPESDEMIVVRSDGLHKWQ